MSNEHNHEPAPVTGFDVPREPEDPFVADLYKEHGLGEKPSLADIEPVVRDLWGDIPSRIKAIELVLGRRVDARGIKKDSILKAVYLQPDVEKALGLLLLLSGSEDINAHNSAHKATQRHIQGVGLEYLFRDT